MDRKWVLVGAVVLLALAAGCTGDDGGGGGSGTAEWCGSGTIEAIASQQGGASMSVESQGMTERDGRDVCQITYEVDAETSEFARMDAFFTDGQEYVEFVYYDADGNVVGQFDYSGDTTGGTDGAGDGSSAGSDGDSSDGSTDGTGDGSDTGSGDGGTGTTGESTEWCQAGQSTTASNPQEGTETSFSVQGMVEYDGRMLCQATLEVSGQDAPYDRIEMFFNEDESYQRIVYYDEDGDVLYEVDVSDGA